MSNNNAGYLEMGKQLCNLPTWKGSSHDILNLPVLWVAMLDQLHLPEVGRKASYLPLNSVRDIFPLVFHLLELFFFQIASHLNIFTESYDNALEEGTSKAAMVTKLQGELDHKFQELAEQVVKVTELEEEKKKKTETIEKEMVVLKAQLADVVSREKAATQKWEETRLKLK